MSLQLRVTPTQLPSGDYMWSIVDVADCTWTPTDGPPMALSTKEMLQTKTEWRAWNPNPSPAKTLDVGYAPSILQAGVEGAVRLDALNQLEPPAKETLGTTWAVMFTGDEEASPGVCYECNQPLIFEGEEAEEQAQSALIRFLERWKTPAKDRDKFVTRPVHVIIKRA